MDRTITVLAISRGTPAEKARLVEKADLFESLLGASEPDLIVAGEFDRNLNLMLARMADSPLFEWVMDALQRGGQFPRLRPVPGP